MFLSHRLCLCLSLFPDTSRVVQCDVRFDGEEYVFRAVKSYGMSDPQGDASAF